MTTVNSKSSQASVTNEINNINREMRQRRLVQVFKDETGTNRIIIGRLPDGTHGLVISKEGIDVYTVFE